MTSHSVDPVVNESRDEPGASTKTPPETEPLGRRAWGRRTAVRYLTAVVSIVVGTLYLMLLVLVFDAESQPEAVVTDSTYGAYLFLSIPYLIGAILSVVTDRRILWVLGAILQIALIVLFALFGVGVFEYEALSDLPMELLAAVITGAQVVLIGLLGTLAFTWRPESQAETPNGRGTSW